MEKMALSSEYISPEVQEAMNIIDADITKEWVDGWIRYIRDEYRTEWVRYGHEEDTGYPGIIEIIVINDQIVNTPVWERLSSDDQFKWCLTSTDASVYSSV